MTARTARFDVSLMGSASIDESVDEGTAFQGLAADAAADTRDK